MKFLFNEKTERDKKMNLFMCMGSTVLLAAYIFFLVSKMANKKINTTLVTADLVMVGVFIVVNIVVYLKKKDWEYYKVLICAEMGLEYFLLAVESEASFISMTLVGILGVCIPYYEKRFHKMLASCYALLFVVATVIRVYKGVNVIDVNMACDTLIILLLFYTFTRVGTISKLFSDDALGSVAEKQAEQKEIMEGVLKISESVRAEADRSKERMEKLYRSSEHTSQSMMEISSATNLTAQNISEQTVMTQNIHEAIEDTAEQSKQMVEVAAASDKCISENIVTMKELQEQAENITETNTQVTEAMQRLQEKTKEVEKIAGMILAISNQTNLLALNASIESARAGEAGKGFAVVAEQIRQLAEQTRESTESISKIVGELGSNADEVVASVQISVEAAGDQQKKIALASGDFEELKKNMDIMKRDIHMVDEKISGLYETNNRIVENIAQVSAATEEVTATASEANDISSQNLSYAGQVKDALDKIIATAGEVDKYL